MMCHCAIKAAGFGNLPRSMQHQLSTWKERERGPDCEPTTPRTLSMAPDYKLTGMLTVPRRLLTTTWQDFSPPLGGL
jgi:hypothetical protein